jgi:hypothetical protein
VQKLIELDAQQRVHLSDCRLHFETRFFCLDFEIELTFYF